MTTTNGRQPSSAHTGRPGWPEVFQRLPAEWLPALLPIGRDKRPRTPGSGQLITGWASDPPGTYGAAILGRAPAVGLRLGPISGGTFALDFDGPDSESLFEAAYGRPSSELPPTIAWTSGKDGRRQVAFRVPEQRWDALRDRVTVLKAQAPSSDKLEHRWTGQQSVIVGVHPETGAYRWVDGCAPWEVEVAEAPGWLLDLMPSKRPAPPQASLPLDSPTGSHASSGCSVPLRDFITRDCAALIESGSLSGNCNEDGLRLSLELVAVEAWLRTQGATPDETARDAYASYLSHCPEWIDRGPTARAEAFDYDRAMKRFNGAAALDPRPSTPEDKLLKRLGYHRWLNEQNGDEQGEPEYNFPDHGEQGQPAQPTPKPIEPPKDEQIQRLLDELLDLMIAPQESWAKQQATRAALWALGVQGGAIDERIYYALAQRWNLPLQTSHAGGSRNRKLSDPMSSPAEDLLPGFLLWRRDHLLFGAGGTGKTLAAAQMAICLIKGLPFLDQQIAPSRTGRVLWIGTDGGEGARAMVREYVEDLGIEIDDPEIEAGLTIWSAEGADGMPSWACTPSGLQELRDELESGDYALVVIDSLKAVLELAGINFSIGPVGTLMRLMQALVGRYCSLLWLHHPAGGKAAGKGLQAAAGSQNINQIPSAVHQITRKIEDRGPSNLWSVHKLRGSTSREFSYRLVETGFEITDGQITANVRTAVLDAIELLNAGGLSSGTSYVASQLPTFNDSTIRNNLTWLRKRGLIRKKGSDWLMTPAGTELLDDVKQGKRDQIK